MKKFIKINFVILVIFCLSCNYLLVPINAETSDEEYSENQEELNEEENQQDEENNQQEDNEEKTLDDLQLEKADLQNIIEESNAQIQFIESDLSNTVVEIAEINQKFVINNWKLKHCKLKKMKFLNILKELKTNLKDQIKDTRNKKNCWKKD